MPIIFDEAVFEPDEPEQPNALEQGVLGLVEGFKAGYEKQQDRNEADRQFEQEKSFQLEKMQREQTFQMDLEEKRQAADRPFQQAQLDRANIEIEAARRAEAATKAREDAANRARWSEAFGDGDVAVGKKMLDDFDRRIAEAEATGGKVAGDAIRSELQKVGEAKHAERQATLANNYVKSVMTSDVFKNNEQLRAEADVILGDPNMDPMQRQSAIKDLADRGKRQGKVTRLKMNTIGRIQRAEETLIAQMAAEQDPEIDAMYQAKINDLHDFQAEWDALGDDDADAAEKLFSDASNLLRSSPSESYYRRNGGRGAVDSRTRANAEYQAELDELMKYSETGAIPEDQIQGEIQRLFGRRFGNQAASGQLPGGKDPLADSILKDLTGDGEDATGSGFSMAGPDPEIKFGELSGAAGLLNQFDKYTAQLDALQAKVDDQIATDEELDQLTTVKANLQSLRNKAASEIPFLENNTFLGSSNTVVRRALAQEVKNSSPVLALQLGAVDLGLTSGVMESFGIGVGATDLRVDLLNLSDQEIRTIRTPSGKEDYDRMVRMLKQANSKIVLNDMQRIGWELGYNPNPSKGQLSRWKKDGKQMTQDEAMDAIASGAVSTFENQFKDVKYTNKGGRPLKPNEQEAAAEELYARMPKGGVQSQTDNADLEERARAGSAKEMEGDQQRVLEEINNLRFKANRELRAKLRDAKNQKDKDRIMAEINKINVPMGPDARLRARPDEERRRELMLAIKNARTPEERKRLIKYLKGEPGAGAGRPGASSIEEARKSPEQR